METAAWIFDENLDAEFLYALYGNDTAHALMVFNDFLKSTPEMMKEIEESYQKGEVENFRQKVHKVKPVFSFVGLTPITHKAEVLEQRCKQAYSIDELKSMYEELKYDYQKNISIVRNEVARLENQKSTL